MTTFNETAVKIRIVKTGLFSRLVILTAAFYLYKKGGFLNSTFKEFIYILLPVSCFYIIFFVKFIIKNAYRYPAKKNKTNRFFIHWGYYGLLAFNLVEFCLILYKALNLYPEIRLEQFYLLIAGTEIAFGLMAVLYISDLFSDQVSS